MSSADPPSIRVDRVAETGSTNTDLLAWARELAASGTPPSPRLLVADRQSAGRGRHGRAWHATAGASLTFSLAWPMRDIDLSGLSLAVGVAIADAIDADRGAGLRIGLKWPNDLWLTGPDEPGRKLGGVLIETTPVPGGRLAVIGVGLNLRQQAVAEASAGVAALEEITATADAAVILGRIVPALLAALETFCREGFEPFVPRFDARDLLAGRAVRCGGDSGTTRDGTAAGVSARGALRLRTPDGSIELVDSGEVSARPMPMPPPRRDLGAMESRC